MVANGWEAIWGMIHKVNKDGFGPHAKNGDIWIKVEANRLMGRTSVKEVRCGPKKL